MTKPALIGTIRGNVPVAGYATKAAQKGILLVDEAEKLTMSTREALLSLLEDQYYSRTLGLLVSQNIEPKAGNFHSFSAKTTKMGTELRIEAKFSAIIATMQFNYSSYFNKALVSRCYPLIVTTDLRDIKDLIFSEPIKPRLEKPPEPVDYVLFPDYYKEGPQVFDYSCADLKTNIETAGFMSRVLGNYARLAAAQAVVNGRHVIECGTDTHVARKLARINAFMYLASRLPILGLRILGIIWNLPPHETINLKEVAKQLGRSEETIDHVMRKMEKTALIRTQSDTNGTIISDMNTEFSEEEDENY
jgi:hypothetical protein